MINIYRYYIILPLFLLLISPKAISQRVVNLNDPSGLLHIGTNASILEDVNQKFTIEEILSDSLQKKFTVSRQQVPNFSSTSSAIWLKFVIKKNRLQDYYLEIGSAFMDSISLYELDKNANLISTRYSGDDLNFENREVLVGNYLFNLDIPIEEQHTFYLRIKSYQPLFFPLRVGSLKSFMEYNHDQDYIQGMYFGFMLLIFLYNLFLYFTIREKIYLYYNAYILSMIWFMASIFGYFFEYFWPNTPSINQNVVVSSGLTMIFATIFTQKFLNTKAFSKKLHIGASVFSITGLLICLLVLFDFKILGLQLAQGGLLLMAIYFLFLGIRFKMDGHPVVKYYLLAWGALIVGIVFALLESLNLIPVMPYVNAMQIGSGLEALLLSFALGERINAYKKQKEAAQALALESAQKNEKLIKDQNALLELEVRKRTEEIALQNKELQQINVEKDTLIGVVAHDLRSPLNQIKGLIQIIKLDTPNLSEDTDDLLDKMHVSAERLTQMTSRILDVSAINSKEILLKLESIHLSEIVTDIAKFFTNEALIKENELIVENNNADNNCISIVDRNYLIQILENIVSNALKFSQPNGKIFIRLNSDEIYNIIEIEDQGPGISEEDQKILFTRFKPLTAKPTGGETSTGLGLFIVKKYIDAMYGEILCESTIGKGTKFTVRFKSTT